MARQRVAIQCLSLFLSLFLKNNEVTEEEKEVEVNKIKGARMQARV